MSPTAGTCACIEAKAALKKQISLENGSPDSPSPMLGICLSPLLGRSTKVERRERANRGLQVVWATDTGLLAMMTKEPMYVNHLPGVKVKIKSNCLKT